MFVLILLVIFFFVVFKFTIIPEGKIVNITTLGSFSKSLLNWKNYKLDKDWNVVPGLDLHLWPFGVRFIGIRGICKVDGEESVKPDSMEVKLEKAETEASERIPIDMLFQVLFQVVNFWKFRFKAPPDAKKVIARSLEALLRGWVSARKYDWVVDCKQSPSAIWNGTPEYIDPNDPSLNRPALSNIREDPVIVGFERDYGIRIVADGIQIMDVGFTKEYQEAIALKEKERLRAEALAKKAETLVESRMAKSLTGGDIKRLRERFENDPVLRQRFEDKCEELVNSLIAYEAGARTEIRGDGISATLESLVDRIMRSLGGGSQNPNPIAGGHPRKNRGNRPGNPPAPNPAPTPQGGQQGQGP